MRLLRTALATALILAAPPLAAAADRSVRIGFQKYGNLLLLKQHGGLDARLKPLGYAAEWSEFPSGPPILEAMRAGAIDFGQTGDAPPIFAQAGRTDLVYVANEPAAPDGEAILVPKDSGIRSLADLKGRRVALNKGSNVHYFLVKALEKAGLSYGDVSPVFLAPADARAAFESGAVDAWAIWDPYLAAAQAATGARTLATAEGVAGNLQFYLADRTFAAQNPKAVAAITDAVREVDAWEAAHPAEAAAELAAAIKLPVPVVATALGRQAHGVLPIGPDVTADQQAVADAFLKLHLIPAKLDVAAAVWKPSP
ncbi:aliphatic sulfonate ABC transporter substrate-binding protein [Lichenibacterium minor]|uniref:Putative aliphatic sulfonates-binding protein n=1 Tax=Lichenibacterium minor TaxID=2316528 RepID=A0A4V1RUI3_9HYPH|nr:aliphatic sulfonate ABC transporter substrate-binding protein [Lichenibacterium minor]RYC31254.1 aliphatic sulfonate ABC transporter substrate-binding protein [Lichenibacterium minor]